MAKRKRLYHAAVAQVFPRRLYWPGLKGMGVLKGGRCWCEPLRSQSWWRSVLS